MQPRFQLLGPVRAWHGSRELDVGSPQRQAVLAALLLSHGRQVSLTALIAALWGERPPRSAASSVRTYVFRLRRSFRDASGGGQEPIETAGDGYILWLNSASLDFEVFERQAREARAARRQGDIQHARALLADALSLWRGAPLAGVPGPYAESQRVRLEELRLAATEGRLQAEIELGGHDAVTADLQELIAAHPLREKLTELLMLALYRSGRQGDALAVFAATQRTLAEQLGVDPGPSLKEMQRRILTTDDSLTRSARSSRPSPESAPLVRPAQLPPDLSAFTGRRDELAQLGSLLEDEPRVRVIVASGMAGIGKTTLVVHWAHQVAERFPDGQLYVNLRGFDPGGPAVPAGEALRGFLSALGVPPSEVPDGIETRTALYRSLLNHRRLLIVLDNARDSAHVRSLLPGSPGSIAVVTSRDELVPLIATHGTRIVVAGLFSPAEARQSLISRLGPGRVAAEPAAATEIIDLCGGLPLATAIVAARAAARPNLPMGAIASELRDAGSRLDALTTRDFTADIRAALSGSHRLLSGAASRLFRLLSVHAGPDISVSAAASLAGLEPRKTRSLLGELTGSHLVTEQLGRFALHDLTRVYAAELSAGADPEADRGEALERMRDHYLHTARTTRLYLGPRFPREALPPPAPGVRPVAISGLRYAVAWFSAERHVLRAVIATAANSGYYQYAGRPRCRCRNSASARGTGTIARRSWARP